MAYPNNIDVCVGEAGLEPATPRPPAWCASQLRHSPEKRTYYIRESEIGDYPSINSGLSLWRLLTFSGLLGAAVFAALFDSGVTG